MHTTSVVTDNESKVQRPELNAESNWVSRRRRMKCTEVHQTTVR